MIFFEQVICLTCCCQCWPFTKNMFETITTLFRSVLLINLSSRKKEKHLESMIVLKDFMDRSNWKEIKIANKYDLKTAEYDTTQNAIVFPYQVLTECKQGQMFASLLSRLEKKPACKGRSLETFLTYPMHQVCQCWICFLV